MLRLPLAPLIPHGLPHPKPSVAPFVRSLGLSGLLWTSQSLFRTNDAQLDSVPDLDRIAPSLLRVLHERPEAADVNTSVGYEHIPGGSVLAVPDG